MRPEETVSALADIFDSLPAISEDAAYERMHAVGIPDRDADRAYKFTQIACARLLLEGIVGRFHDKYFWLNASGDTVESGRIQDEPFFAAAATLLRTRRCLWAANLGAMSADVAAINDLLKRGSKPGNLETGPPVLFLEMPTVEGMRKADQLTAPGLGTRTRPTRAWWQFWRPN